MLPIKIEINESFFKEEKRCDFFVSQNTKKIWAVLLDLLNEFSIVCEKNGIEWFVDAGTILGAARHKGFIPWDDDIDIMLDRKNYEKLCLVAPKDFKHPYFFQTEYTDPGSLRGHAQLRNSLTTAILETEKDKHYRFNQGIFIDIFPIDNLPDDLKERKRFLAKLQRAKKRTDLISSVTTRYSNSAKVVKRIIKGILHLVFGSAPKKELKLFKKYESLEMKYCSLKTKYMSKLFQLPLNERRIWERQWLKDTVFLEFEMLKVPVPLDYVKLLDKFYGDWRVYKKGLSTHGGVFFDPENTYLKYI